MSNNNFSERLISLERDTPEFRERYEKGITAMLEKTLKPAQRIAFGLSALVSTACAVFFAYVGLTMAQGFPLPIRLSFGLGALFSIAWAFTAGRAAVKGSMNLRRYPNTATNMIWVFAVTVQAIFLVIGSQHPDKVSSVFMVLYGLPFLVSGAVFLLGNRIEQSELNTKEKLLRIELRLAEMAEEIKGQSRK